MTDADLILGKLDPDGFAGGTIPLSVADARAAMDSVLGQHLGMDAAEAAWGLAEVVDENMANAARVHAVENGEDLSEYTMIAFGGAAPLHAARLCEKLGVDRCLIPQGAGVGSAIGFLRAAFSFEANRSVFMRMSAFDPNIISRVFVELQAEATGFVRSCDADAGINAGFKAYMRYAGQGWEIPVAFTPDQASHPDAATYLALFEAEYAALFGRTVVGMEVEITVWSVNAFTLREAAVAVAEVPAGAAVAKTADRALFDAGLGVQTRAAVYNRADFIPGSHITGPAVITEDETTIVVPTSRRATALADGCIDMRKRDAPDAHMESVDA